MRSSWKPSPIPAPIRPTWNRKACEERLQQLHDGHFGFMGIRASCTLYIDVGQHGHTIMHCFKSPGIWNVETDSSEEHIQQLFEDQRSLLLTMLDAIGRHHVNKAVQSN